MRCFRKLKVVRRRVRRWVAKVEAQFLVVIFFGAPGVILLSYIYDRYESGMSFDPESWGQLGDFLGGVLNPFVALLTVLILVRTVKQNQDVIDISREELLASRKALDATLEELKISRVIQGATQDALSFQANISMKANEIQLINNYLMNTEKRLTETLNKNDKCKKLIASNSSVISEARSRLSQSSIKNAIDNAGVEFKNELERRIKDAEEEVEKWTYESEQLYILEARLRENRSSALEMIFHEGDLLVSNYKVGQANSPADASSPT